MDALGRLSGWAIGIAHREAQAGYLERLKDRALRLVEQEAANQRVRILPGSQEFIVANESDRTGCARTDRRRLVVRCIVRIVGP